MSEFKALQQQIDRGFEGLREDIQRLYDAVFGNGQDGLKPRLQALETRCTTCRANLHTQRSRRWDVVKIVVAAFVSSALTLVVSKGWIFG